MPIGSISSVLDIDSIDSHLDKLSLEQLKEMYGDYLPPSIASNPTKVKLWKWYVVGFSNSVNKNSVSCYEATQEQGI